MNARVAAAALLVCFLGGCKKAQDGPPIRIKSPETGTQLVLQGFEPHPSALKGVPALGRQPALTPAGDAQTFDVSIRWATSTLARHPEGILLSFQQIHSPGTDCLKAFLSEFEPVGYAQVGPEKPQNFGGVDGVGIVTKATLKDAGPLGPLMTHHFLFSHGGKCYQVEAATAEPAYEKNRERMDQAVGSLQAL